MWSNTKNDLKRGWSLIKSSLKRRWSLIKYGLQDWSSIIKMVSEEGCFIVKDGLKRRWSLIINDRTRGWSVILLEGWSLQKLSYNKCGLSKNFLSTADLGSLFQNGFTTEWISPTIYRGYPLIKMVLHEGYSDTQYVTRGVFSLKKKKRSYKRCGLSLKMVFKTCGF